MVKISSVEKTIIKDSLSIETAVEDRSVASFDIDQPTGEFRKGQPVEIYDDDNDLIYAGVIEKAPKVKDGSSYIHSITCIDWHYLADKRIIAKSYENTAAGDIVRDIITNYLSEEGITIGEIQTGATVYQSVFNYVYITQALDALAEYTGFIWYIDELKRLYFIDRETYTAPFTITEKDCLKDSIQIEKDNPKYRNRQYVKGVRDITDPYSEKHKGDGSTRSWTVPFPVAYEPTININGVTVAASDIGIRGVETGKKFYWNKNDKVVSQDSSQIVLAASDEIEIISQGYFDIVAFTSNQVAIDELKSVEGAGTGYVDAVDTETEISTRDAAFQLANKRLEKYGTIDYKIQFKTHRKGLKPGQLLPVDYKTYDVNTTALIESVTIERINNKYVYSVTAVEGPTHGSWTKMFTDIANARLSTAIRENISEKEVLALMQNFSKTWLSTDSKNIFLEYFPSATLYPSASRYPSFDHQNRVRYIELLDTSNNVLLRKGITKQTGADTSSIQSIIMILPLEGLGQIAKVRFYGGYNANESTGSGVLIDEQTYSHLKTQLETIQITKTDIKGW